MNEPIARGPPWTDEAIARLRQRLLDDALIRLSRPSTSERTRQALLAWVLCDAIHPFSFRVCAAASGCDADALRDNLLRLLGADARQNDPAGVRRFKFFPGKAGPRGDL
jgi:hypothetical protein